MKDNSFGWVMYIGGDGGFRRVDPCNFEGTDQQGARITEGGIEMKLEPLSSGDVEGEEYRWYAKFVTKGNGVSVRTLPVQGVRTSLGLAKDNSSITIEEMESLGV